MTCCLLCPTCATVPAQQLSSAASDAFIHSLNGTYPILGAIALAGELMAALLLPSRPKTPTVADVPAGTPPEPAVEPVMATRH